MPADSICSLGAAPHERMAEYAFYLRILRPLSWFGLLHVDRHQERWFDSYLWQIKLTPMFASFIHFDVRYTADRRVH